MDIGETIRRLRVQHGLTQEELGLRTDLTKGFISQLERNLTSPSIATLMDILECLGTDLKNFLDVYKRQIQFDGIFRLLNHQPGIPADAPKRLGLTQKQHPICNQAQVYLGEILAHDIGELAHPFVQQRLPAGNRDHLHLFLIKQLR